MTRPVGAAAPAAPVAAKAGITAGMALIIWTALFVVMEYRLITRYDFPL